MMKLIILTIFICSALFAQDEAKYLSNIAFHHQGEALNFRCETIKTGPKYSTPNDYAMAAKSVVATLQLMGLRITSSAILDYAKLFELEDSELSNIVENLVNNDCSKNITVLSKKGIKNLFKKELKENHIPNFEKNLYFTNGVKDMLQSRQAKMNEFKNTIENFRSFRSWNHLEDSYRLMAPFLANQYVMNYVYNSLLKKKTTWNQNYKEIVTSKDTNTTRVTCKDLFCRQRNDIDFVNTFPRMLGSSELNQDLSALYCEEFKNQVLEKTGIAKLDKIIKSKSQAQTKAEVMNFVSLITKTPDILNGVSNSSELLNLFNQNVLAFWDDWSKKELDNSSYSLLFEEALNIDLIPQLADNSTLSGNFSLTFRYTLGEYDRMFKAMDKIDAKFSLVFPSKYISWYRREYIGLNNKSNYVGLKDLKKNFKTRVDLKLKKKGDFFLTNLWNEKMAQIIVDELTKQILAYNGDLDQLGSKETAIPLKMEFGIFALKFIREKYEANFVKESLISKK